MVSARNGRQAAEYIRMQCPFCKAKDARVVDSRETDGGVAIRRRRECTHCHKRFTSYERAQTFVRATVVKKDGSRVPYDRSKILTGLEKACYKRPVSEDQLAHVVDKIEETISAKFNREVPAKFIGEQAAGRLRSIDQVAYVRFASVYREFRDVGEFIDEARKVMEGPPPEAPGQQQLFE